MGSISYWTSPKTELINSLAAKMVNQLRKLLRDRPGQVSPAANNECRIDILESIHDKTPSFLESNLIHSRFATDHIFFLNIEKSARRVHIAENMEASSTPCKSLPPVFDGRLSFYTLSHCLKLRSSLELLRCTSAWWISLSFSQSLQTNLS